MSRFASHFLMLMLGLIAGVVLAVMGFSPQQMPDRSVRGLRERAMPQIERPVAGTGNAADQNDEVSVAAPPVKSPTAERTPDVTAKKEAAAKTSTALGELRGRLHRASIDEGTPLGVALARVHSFDSADPDVIARTADFTNSGRRGSPRSAIVRGDRFDFADLEEGRYWLVVSLSGRRLADRQIELRAGEAAEFDLDVASIAPALRVRLNVTDDRGAPIREATFTLAMKIDTAAGERRNEEPIWAQPHDGSHYSLLVSWLAANLRSGRLNGSCMLKVGCWGYETKELSLVDVSSDEIAIALIRKSDGGTTRFRLHVERADRGRAADFLGASVMGPAVTPENPKAHEMGRWSDSDGNGDALFESLPHGDYRGEIFARCSDAEGRSRVAVFSATVDSDHPEMTVKLPPLHRVIVVAPPEFAALRPELVDPEAAVNSEAPLGDGLGETVFPLVTAGPHDVCFGGCRMRIDVKDDLRVDFVADRTPKIPVPANDGKR